MAGYGKRYRVDCKICKKPMWVIRAHYLSGRKKTCSKPCLFAWRSKYMRNKKGKKAEIARIENQIAYVRLSETYEAIIDTDTIPLIQNRPWSAHNNHANRGVIGNIYAYSHGRENRKSILMHRLIMRPKKNELVDHINGNSLDNRRINLRICTASENMQNMHKYSRKNKTGYVGVTRNNEKEGGNFSARIKIKNKVIQLGTFSTAKEAHEAYRVERKNIYQITMIYISHEST